MEKGTTNAGAVATVPTVPNAIEAINKKIASLKHIADSVFKTNGKVKMAGGGNIL